MWYQYGDVTQKAVYIRTAGVPKYGLRQSTPLSLVYCHARFWHRTHTVQGPTGSPNLCTKAAQTPVRHVHQGGIRICTVGV